MLPVSIAMKPSIFVSIREYKENIKKSIDDFIGRTQEESV